MFTDAEGIRSGAMWGLYFIVVAFVFSFQRVINTVFAGSFTVKFISLEGLLFLLFLTAVAHIRGYIYLGTKYDSRSLKYTAIVQSVATAFLGFFLLLQIFLRAFSISDGNIYDALISFCIVVLILAEVFYLYALIKLKKHTGPMSLFAAPLPFWVVVMWYGWPAILVFIPSILFLWKESNT